ncbi:gluconate 2-dehydrogenase subunit 3 family protein [Echinicola shivajiensis]|uniref:gluconate 2-dehydrogenase subunit 3 family protein n=1 Tax=Echinicola shivajiensis TaxID=1035916 RepID=UPI001BFC40F6|nr:gluconate 2-dehydrogenase subunit 3 family protein [Echinicola shivajiensis]
MNRRDALTKVALIMGGTVVGANLFLTGCSREASKTVESLFSPEIIDFLGDISDTILPPTSSPGAKEAGVGEFIPVMVRDCYSQIDQQIIVEGIGKLENSAKSKYNRIFQELTKAERTELLTIIDKESIDHQQKKGVEEPRHYFYLIKQITLLGYFTSELGTTKALRYVAIPGKYIGDYPYKEGDKAWA